MSTAVSYPVRVDLDAPFEVARWKPLLAWLMAIPHMVVLYVLQVVMSLVTFVAWFAILFTGAYPRGMFDLTAMVLRYQWRVTSYILWLRDPYPAFEFTTSAADPGTDPAELDVEYPERLSRGLIFVKWLLAIPHFVVLAVLGLAVMVVLGISWFAVLFTGRWPQGMRDFVVGVTRWSMRATAYAYLLTDVYPPFTTK